MEIFFGSHSTGPTNVYTLRSDTLQSVSCPSGGPKFMNIAMCSSLIFLVS